MRIPAWLATVIVTSYFASQGWLILTVIDLKADVSVLKAVTVNQTLAHK